MLPVGLLSVYLMVLLGRFAYKGGLFLSFFDDDYFYYLIVARNIVNHGMSSFNGIQLTNGYHPLWMVTNVALYRVFGERKIFFVALVLLIWLLVCATYKVLRGAQAALGIAGGYGLACAVMSITFMAVICRTGMEISLTLLFLALLWRRMATQPLEEQTPRNAMLSGLIASGVVLGRLDANIVIAVYCGLMLLRPVGTRKAALRSLMFFCVGLLPVAAYFLFNHVEFGAFLPISGLAKNLKQGMLPSASTAKSLLQRRAINLLLTWPACVLGLLYALRLMRGGVKDESIAVGGQRVQLCVLLHPVLFYCVLSMTSDWQLWSWYLYPLVPIAALLGPSALADWKTLRGPAMVLWVTAAASCVSVLTVVSQIRLNPINVLLFNEAQQMRTFATAHPGVYAMGGGAGFPAYMMPAPMVQVEGLMADAAFLDRVKRKQPLVDALSELGVDYYLTMLLSDNYYAATPCFDVREPEMAGHRSPVMAGHLCVPPIADFSYPPGVHHLLVFDVHALKAAEMKEAAYLR